MIDTNHCATTQVTWLKSGRSERFLFSFGAPPDLCTGGKTLQSRLIHA